MLDVLVAVLVIVFFALAVAYTDAAGWLIGPSGGDDARNGDDHDDIDRRRP